MAHIEPYVRYSWIRYVAYSTSEPIKYGSYEMGDIAPRLGILPGNRVFAPNGYRQKIYSKLNCHDKSPKYHFSRKLWPIVYGPGYYIKYDIAYIT